MHATVASRPARPNRPGTEDGYVRRRGTLPSRLPGPGAHPPRQRARPCRNHGEALPRCPSRDRPREPPRLGPFARPAARLPVRGVVLRVVAVALVVVHTLRRRGDLADRGYHRWCASRAASKTCFCACMAPTYGLSGHRTSRRCPASHQWLRMAAFGIVAAVRRPGRGARRGLQGPAPVRATGSKRKPAATVTLATVAVNAGITFGFLKLLLP